MTLLTEQNTPEVDQLIQRASALHHATTNHATATFFEHGQWWLSCIECGRQWSVVDAEGGPAVEGFDFEEVTHGDDEDDCDRRQS